MRSQSIVVIVLLTACATTPARPPLQRTDVVQGSPAPDGTPHVMLAIRMIGATDAVAQDLGLDPTVPATGFKQGSATEIDARIARAEAGGGLETLNSATVVTAPDTLASWHSGLRLPYSTVSATGDETTWVEANFALELVPHLDAHDVVRLNLRSKEAHEAPPGAGPASRHDATTEVAVRAGDTVAIGGIYRAELQNHPVPFFSSLPLIGGLFERRQVERRNYFILIRPTVFGAAPSAGAAGDVGAQ